MEYRDEMYTNRKIDMDRNIEIRGLRNPSFEERMLGSQSIFAMT